MNTWPDGTPKSSGNDFSISIGRPSSIGKEIQLSATKSKLMSESVNKLRAEGKDLSMIPGLSNRSAQQERDPKRFAVGKKKK